MSYAQYKLSDVGKVDSNNNSIPVTIQATTNLMVDPPTMTNAGKGQIQLPDDGKQYFTVDLSKNPPVFA